MVSSPVRVLIVDDSAYIRKVFAEILRQSPRIEVVGTAWDGRDALEKVAELNPDVVTLDLNMPELDGLGFLEEQMKRRPLPVVVCTAAGEGEEQVLAAMEAGAIDFIQKPTTLAVEKVYEISDTLIKKVIISAGIQVNNFYSREGEQAVPVPPLPGVAGRRGIRAVVIGASTGGPQALRYLLASLPANFPAAVAVVLHMPEGYTGPFAQRVNSISQVDVLEAEAGMEMKPGRVILAKAGIHFLLERRNSRVVVRLDMTPSDLPHRPAVDVLFHSAADVYGARLIGAVLTGMGSDGTLGAAWIKAQGGQVYTESETTCVVYGMPRAVVEAGLSDKMVLLSDFPRVILEAL